MTHTRRRRVKFYDRMPTLTWDVGAGVFPTAPQDDFTATVYPGIPETQLDVRPNDGYALMGFMNQSAELARRDALARRDLTHEARFDPVPVEEVNRFYSMAYTQMESKYRRSGAQGLQAAFDRIIWALSRFTKEGVPADPWFNDWVDNFNPWLDIGVRPFRYNANTGNFETATGGTHPEDQTGKDIEFTILFERDSDIEQTVRFKTRWLNWGISGTNITLTTALGHDYDINTYDNDLQDGLALPTTDWSGTTDLSDAFQPIDAVWGFRTIGGIDPIPSNREISQIQIKVPGAQIVEHNARLLSLSDTAVPLQGLRGTVLRRSMSLAVRRDANVLPGWYCFTEGRFWQVLAIQRPPGGYIEVTLG